VSLPRLLVIMGSGETSPTMVKTHRQVLARLGPPPVPAVLLDTPFGFQENAPDIAAKAVEYFAQSVGQEIEVASYRSVAAATTLDYERVLTRMRAARYLFAGPGSPSYALRQWQGTQIPAVLASKLDTGGAVAFASAAALTLGLATVPVYEVYKVGEDPRWLPGLDLLASAGLRAAVIPHYNNAEGGHHDTRFCYLGERRLSAIEGDLPEDAFVLGVDEHTGLILDLDAGTASVVGNDVVTVRKAGRSAELAAGTTVAIGSLAELAAELASAAGPSVFSVSSLPSVPVSGGAAGSSLAAVPTGRARSPLLTAVAAHEQRFDAALAARDPAGAAAAVLDLESELVAWSRDTLQSDELDRGRAALRSMIVRLGELADRGARDPREVVGPYVDALLELRRQARADRRFAEADGVRDRLAGMGVEVRDTPDGTEWALDEPAARG